MDVEDISYSTAPLSEYIGSHVYSILGFPVHETFLGYRVERYTILGGSFNKVYNKILISIIKN